MNLIKRKLTQKWFQVYKNLDKNKGSVNNFPVFLNSFPKSGTHLLYQIFENFPELKKYFTFIVSMPSFFHYERSLDSIIKQLNKVVPGELVRGHLFYHEEVLNLLIKKNFVNYFIYRDPRDVVISEANYLYDMNKFHGLHKYYKGIDDLSERIKFSILGNKYLKTKYTYEDINERFKRYQKWIYTESVFAVKYEDLMSEKRDEFIREIIKFYCVKTECDNLDNLESTAMKSIDPQKSHTFREGGTNKWKKYFNEEHKELFKKIAGELLIELGYEKNNNW